MGRIIQQDRSIIVACDVGFEKYVDILKDTGYFQGIGAYKIPARSGRKGWETWVEAGKKYTNKPLIFDGQKWGNDIPDTGPGIMSDIKESGFDAVILFPFAGPVTQYVWTQASKQLGLELINGAKMTHPRHVEGDYSSPKKGPDYSAIFRELGFENDITGYLRATAPEDMTRLAARLGITNYVAPGNQPAQTAAMKELLEAEGIEPVFYSPGFLDVAQGGKISDAGKAAGRSWHAIVGTGIYGSSDYRRAAEDLSREILSS